MDGESIEDQIAAAKELGHSLSLLNQNSSRQTDEHTVKNLFALRGEVSNSFQAGYEEFKADHEEFLDFSDGDAELLSYYVDNQLTEHALKTLECLTNLYCALVALSCLKVCADPSLSALFNHLSENPEQLTYLRQEIEGNIEHLCLTYLIDTETNETHGLVEIDTHDDPDKEDHWNRVAGIRNKIETASLIPAQSASISFFLPEYIKAFVQSVKDEMMFNAGVFWDVHEDKTALSKKMQSAAPYLEFAEHLSSLYPESKTSIGGAHMQKYALH